MIAVAHRLSTIQTADVIFVFDDGKVVEKGSHAELVKKQCVYWEMVSFTPLLLSHIANRSHTVSESSPGLVESKKITTSRLHVN